MNAIADRGDGSGVDANGDLANSAAHPRIAYVVGRFPKLTETFVLNEMLAVGQLGVAIDVYPLVRERETVLQPGARELVARARYVPFVSPGVLASHAHFLRHAPRAYIGSLVDLVRDNLGRSRFLFRSLAVFPKAVHMARAMQEAGIEHVHCHFARYPALAGLIVHRLTGIPYSFTAHGSDVHVDRGMLCRKLTEASFAVTIAEFNRSVIETECGPVSREKLAVLHCGVDTTVFAPRAEPPSAEVEGLRIVSVGTIHEVKGHKYLIEACSLLRAAGVAFSCRIIGSGPDEADLRRSIRSQGLEACVTLTGPMPRDAVIEELRTADVLAAPSVVSARGQREGIPVVLMEAMSCGLPVVASRLSGIPELVDDGTNGLLVTPADSRELAGALERLARDSDLRRRLGAEGRRTVERDFDLHANAERLVAMFERVSAG